MDVYRKPTHTDRYLDFFSCHPLCHKRSVVNTLLKRANNIPSTNKGRREETQRVKDVLRDNNYPMSFIRNCVRALTKELIENNFNGFIVLPYVQGVSEKIGRILKQQKVKVPYKPQQTITINNLFPRPKKLDDSDRHKSGIVYSHVHQFSHNMNSANVKVAGVESNYHERLSLKPGTLLWTRTLGTITSYFQKPTKASREHESHGHARKLRVTLL